MSQPQLQPPATPEQEAAELEAAIEASKASAAAFEEFAETLAVIEAFDIQENNVEFERVKAESRQEYDELERALQMSLLDERSQEHAREAVDRLRKEKAIRELVEGHIEVNRFVSVSLGVPGNLPIEVDAPAVRPKRRGLEDPE
jgi:hypothetical protein